MLAYAQLQPFVLAGSGSNIADTTLTLTAFNDINGNALTMTAFGSKGYGTLEPSSQAQEEQISFTGITPLSGGNVQLTGVSHVAFLTPYTETSGMNVAHAGGVRFVISNTSGFYATFANKQNNETIAGTYTFTVPPVSATDPTIATQVANRHYVDVTAVAGAPNADTATKGIVQIATGAQLAAGTAIGSTGASVVPNGGSFKNVSAGAGDVNKIPVLNAVGQLDPTFVQSASATVNGTSQLATAAQMAAGTAAGSTGAALVPPNSQLKNFAASTDVNKVPVTGTNGALDPSFLYTVFTSGEALTAGQPVYIKAADSRVYRTIATGDESTYSFTGFAMDTVGAAALSVRVAMPGQLAIGLSGLVAGTYYYLADVVGTIATAPGTRYAKVAQAVSTTTVRVIEPKFIRTGTTNVPSITPVVVTTGFYPANIQVLGDPGTNSYGLSVSLSDSLGSVGFGPYIDGAAGSFYYGGNWQTTNSVHSVQANGSITAKTATGFTLTPATSNAAVSIRWVATN